MKSKKLQTCKNPVLNQDDVEAYLENSQDRYVIVPIDKASNAYLENLQDRYVIVPID